MRHREVTISYFYDTNVYRRHDGFANSMTVSGAGCGGTLDVYKKDINTPEIVELREVGVVFKHLCYNW